MITNYIPLDKIPEEVSHVADRRLVNKLEGERDDLLEKLNENTP